MGAGFIAAGDEWVFAFSDGCKRVLNGRRVSNTCWVVLWTAEHEVVVQEGNAFCIKAVHYASKTSIDKFFFLGF